MRKTLRYASAIFVSATLFAGVLNAASDPAQERVEAAFASVLKGGASLFGPTNLDWSDIPVLLDLADSRTVLEFPPANPISSHMMKKGVEGMVALWLIEGIRCGHLDMVRAKQTGSGRGIFVGEGAAPVAPVSRFFLRLPLNPACLTAVVLEQERRARTSDEWQAVSASRVVCEASLEIHATALAAYRQWWETVRALPVQEAVLFNPLDLAGLEWMGWNQFEVPGPLEMSVTPSPAGTVAQRFVRGLEEYMDKPHEPQSRPGKTLRIIYYNLKDRPTKAQDALPAPKGPYPREMLAIHSAVAYFYDMQGRELYTKEVSIKHGALTGETDKGEKRNASSNNTPEDIRR
jgi:hypothetical protein